MWIVFGTRTVDHELADGEFHCPECDGIRPYHRHRVRRFFHVFFIPLVPLRIVDEYAVCATCRSTFKPSVLPQALPEARVTAGASALPAPRDQARPAAGDDYDARLDRELDDTDA